MELKDKIVEVAYDLFATKGYDKTTIADIIKGAGASKGGFYHHFKSKDEILEKIIFASIEEIVLYYKEVLDDDSTTAVAKLSESFYRLNEAKKESAKDWNKLKKLYTFKGNHVLLKRMAEAFEEQTADFYHHLIKQGIESGEFQVQYPKQLGALWSREVIKFHQMSRRIFTGVKDNEDEFYDMLKFDEELINSQLGIESGRIRLVEMGDAYLQSMKKIVREGML
ncbi:MULTISPECIES: TetR/AcrR family transcriptional regulator [unclassified Fusibacter]|uniref:TetR/AcrR family transcriptional regulator n=1 Tax=unclassified Fusibacter TaxID=2624464 RepID=UPI001011C54A|nr:MULTISPECIES: TetR/AcrR family transcriptional regulator [unclassified Fusibacter]MCK8060248.1 TetR/AcrR family transcriptional regulator [Fusibacter sp. A2]NPE20465.1 TetR/AcrR family transcriptional regulator [Fusibacter sp. A1]RXV63670.1 TetR/AcrR family transcriptional regulator [Fusibacter sp. A1]